LGKGGGAGLYETQIKKTGKKRKIGMSEIRKKRNLDGQE
jgi:hypothetical protein